MKKLFILNFLFAITFNTLASSKRTQIIEKIDDIFAPEIMEGKYQELHISEINFLKILDSIERNIIPINFGTEEDKNESILSITLAILDNVKVMVDNVRLDTPTEIASFYGFNEFLRYTATINKTLLLKHRDIINRTLLHYAIAGKSIDTAIFLIQEVGVSTMFTDDNLETSLHLAVSSGKFNMVKMIINETSYYLKKQGKRQLLKRFILYKNILGFDAIDVARSTKQEEIANYLENLVKTRHTSMRLAVTKM